MKRILTVLSLINVLMIQGSLSAQSFTVDVPYDTVYLGNTITISFLAENIEGRIECNMKDLPVISGPSQSSSTMIINGEMNSTKSLSYVLEPFEAGIVEVPVAYLYTNDEALETSPLSILVLENPDNIVQDDKSKDGGFFFNDQFFRKSIPPSKQQGIKKKRKLKKI